jgi:hypothetical protein
MAPAQQYWFRSLAKAPDPEPDRAGSEAGPKARSGSGDHIAVVTSKDTL